MATFNLESFDLRPGRSEEFGRRVAALRPMLLALDADVLCLQEVNAQKKGRGARRFEALDALLQETRYAAYHRAASWSPGTRSPADVHNLLILSRFPIVESRTVHHDIVQAWNWRRPADAAGAGAEIAVSWERPLLYARLQGPGEQPLHVLNLHLRAPRPAHIAGAKRGSIWPSTAAWAEGLMLAAQKRIGQALEARLLVERLFDEEPTARIAVCGDFNADEHELPTRLLVADMGDEGDSAGAARALVALEKRVEPSRQFSVLHGGRHVMLDHVLASRALAGQCVDVEILNDGLTDEVAAGVSLLPGSLHAPVVAMFRTDR